MRFGGNFSYDNIGKILLGFGVALLWIRLSQFFGYSRWLHARATLQVYICVFVKGMFVRVLVFVKPCEATQTKMAPFLHLMHLM